MRGIRPTQCLCPRSRDRYIPLNVWGVGYRLGWELTHVLMEQALQGEKDGHVPIFRPAARRAPRACRPDAFE